MYKFKKFLAVLVITLVLVFAMSFAFVGCKKQTIITPTTQTIVSGANIIFDN